MFVLIAHRKTPFIVGMVAGIVKHPQATFDYSFFTRQQARSVLEKMQIEGVIVLLGKGRYAKYVACERLL